MLMSTREYELLGSDNIYQQHKASTILNKIQNGDLWKWWEQTLQQQVQEQFQNRMFSAQDSS